jgi:hypothetical protein
LTSKTAKIARLLPCSQCEENRSFWNDPGQVFFAGDSCSGRRHTLISLTDERTILVPACRAFNCQWFVYILREAMNSVTSEPIAAAAMPAVESHAQTVRGSVHRGRARWIYPVAPLIPAPCRASASAPAAVAVADSPILRLPGLLSPHCRRR